MMANGASRVAVIVAAIDARGDIAPVLARLVEETEGLGRVVVVDGSIDRQSLRTSKRFPRVESLRRPAGSLVPELWRDGLNATSEPFIVFTTYQMIPTRGWLAALLRSLEKADAAAIVGGPIEAAANLDVFDRAVYLQRYVRYMRPLPNGSPPEPPGENALYRRERIEDLHALIASGFWEAEVNRVLRERGEALVFEDQAVVTYRGGAQPSKALRRRSLHARHYAAGRAKRFRPGERLARTLLTPLVPIVMLARIARALSRRRVRVRPWLAALPWLVALIAAWTFGEVAGMWRGVPRSRSNREGDPGSALVAASHAVPVEG
jgi:hypothetical protein